MGAFCFGGRKMDQVYGYVRVSTKEQNEARQIAAMREVGVAPGDIYMDKQSGADFERCSIGGCCGGWDQATR